MKGEGTGEDVEEFLSEGFDVEFYAQKILASGADIGEQLSVLAANSIQLDKQLRKQISAHHEKLLIQATSIESLEDVLETLNQHISALKGSVDRATGRTNELFKKTEIRTVQLERLHRSCNLLRAMIRIVSLAGKIEKLRQSHGGRDMVKSSQMLQELTEITQEYDMRGIEVLEKDVAALPRLNNEIVEKGRKMMKEGLVSHNQTMVGYAVQTFSHLKRLEGEKQSLISQFLEDIGQEVGDLGRGGNKTAGGAGEGEGRSGGPGGASMPAAPTSVMIRASLWKDVQKLSASLVSVQSQMEVLESVLVKRKEEEEEVMGNFWTSLNQIVEKEIGQKTGLVNQTLESEYPKLLRHLDEVFLRVRGSGGEGGGGFRQALAKLEKAYLSKSLSRLYDCVNLAFSEDKPPEKGEIENIGQVMLSEIQVAAFDPILLTQVLQNVAKTATHFGDKCEALISIEGEVIGNPTTVQKRNVSVANAVEEFRVLLEGVREGVGEDGGLDRGCTEYLLSLMHEVLDPLMVSVECAMTSIVNTMHEEDFSFPLPSQRQAAEQQCSMYMRELGSFVSRVWEDHLAPFRAKDVVYAKTSEVGRNICQLFLIQASLVRPLGEGGRLRLAADCAQMELALSPLCRRLNVDLGLEYASLRAFRPLLFLSPGEVVECEAVGKSIPFWLALHLVISRSPPEIPSPHVSAGWTLARYSQWLQQHPNEKERLHFLKGTLESYARSVQTQNKTTYADNYPLLVEFLRKTVETLSLN